MNERINKWVNKWMSKWKINEWMNEWVNEWMKQWRNEWMNEWLNEWSNEWIMELILQNDIVLDCTALQSPVIIISQLPITILQIINDMISHSTKTVTLRSMCWPSKVNVSRWECKYFISLLWIIKSINPSLLAACQNADQQCTISKTHTIVQKLSLIHIWRCRRRG